MFKLVGSWVHIYHNKKTLEEMKTKLSEIASLASDFKHVRILFMDYIMKILCETIFFFFFLVSRKPH